VAAGVAGLGLTLLCTGCSGINAQGSVSPATFLLPGLMQVQPESSPPTAPTDPIGAPLTVAQAR